MAFTGLTFDSNHLPGDYDFSLLTITEIVLQGILLLCSISVVMFSAWRTRGTVTSNRPDFRLEVSMSPIIERSMTDNVLQCVPGGSRFHQARWFPYELLAKKEVTCQVPFITLFTLSCQPSLTRCHLPSFSDTRVFACSLFPHRLMFTTVRL